MVKECEVLSYNKFLKILVFEYNGQPVQTTCETYADTKIVYVKYEKGIYSVVSKDEYEKANKTSVKKKEKNSEDISAVDLKNDSGYKNIKPEVKNN